MWNQKGYTHDAFNRTIRVEQADGRIVQHGYDPEGLRSRLDTDGTVRHFVHDGWHVVNELDDSRRVQASYIRGHEWLTQLDDQGEVAYYVNNIHGDVTHLTGSQGQILKAYTYDAFGNMLSAREQHVNPFRYAGEMQDALTGHYYLRARFYNPIIARFTQEDTYRGDGLNLYAYVANNPIRYVDPSGYAKAGSGGTPASCVSKGDTHGSSEGAGKGGWLSGKTGEVNWKSKPNFGHTFDTHGAGKKNLESLKGRSRTVNEVGEMTEQGQWLDNQKAAEFLNSYGKVDKPTIVDIPEGLGQVIKPSWEMVPVTRAVIIPNSKTGKLKTAYPVSDTFKLKE